MNKMKKQALFILLALIPAGLAAQQRLTLEECRQMAIAGNASLGQASVKVEMAKYDKAIAYANYFPEISAKGAYMYNSRNLSLIGEDASSSLRNAGTAVQSGLTSGLEGLTQAIMSNPAALAEYMSSPMWQTVIGALSTTDVSGAINSIGAQIDDALHLDISNVYVGAVMLRQPVFMGGKIVAANRIASLAEELAVSQYDTEYQQILVDVDQAYWQVVSIAAKKELAESFAELLGKMERDVRISIEEGVATEADALTIRVKANEAAMLLAKSTNGLRLARMLLCRQVGLPLDTDIVLADEGGEDIPLPQMSADKPMEQIYADRAELRSLDLAAQIYEGKINVARADMMPQVAVTAGWLISNPNLNDGFRNSFNGGMFSAGVVVNVPLFHGFEALSRTRRAKAEAGLYRMRLEDTRNLVDLEVNKLRSERQEALDRLRMAESNLESAEENLRTAMIGFEEGVVETNVTLAAQTAWLQAHSEYIDAGIELRMTDASLRKAEGNYTSYQDSLQ